MLTICANLSSISLFQIKMAYTLWLTRARSRKDSLLLHWLRLWVMEKLMRSPLKLLFWTKILIFLVLIYRFSLSLFPKYQFGGTNLA